ncbi:MAG: hypothetical protein FWE49_05570, partial [Synergistaceae bacterium]|nr:hypothetical protein [Synergistaceae bacterium]
MIRRFVLIIFAFVMAVVIFQPAVPVQAAEELKEYLFRGMTDYSLEDQSRNFERLTIKIMNPENEEFEDKTFEGNRVYSYYNYAGNDEKRPSDFQLMRYNQSALQKLGGEILWESGNEFHASFTRNNKQFYMKVFSNNGYHYEVYILELAELDYDVEILNDDTIVRGMTDYELEEQTRKFERLTIYFNNTE